MAIPTPEGGLVVSHGYLSHHENMAGQEEGRKTRPAVTVLVTRSLDDGVMEVTVLPITRRSPENPDWAVEIPLPVKRHLMLDDALSWIVVAEGNEFLWPGYDLRKISGTDRYDHGFLPPRFFNQLIGAFNALWRGGQVRLTARD